MDETPTQMIDDVEFREVRRGYDPAEVDAFLDRVASAMAKLHQQLTEATERATAAEQRLAQPAEAAAPASDAATTDQLQRTLVLAQRTADAAIHEAQQEADALREQAQAESERILSEAHATADRSSAAARDSSIAELRDLEQVRTSLQADIALLQNHVAAHRATLGQSISELQRWLDDPTALRVVSPEGLSGAGVPAAAPEPERASAPEPEPVPELESEAESAPEAEPAPAPAPDVAVSPETDQPVAEPEPEPEPEAEPEPAAAAEVPAELPLDPAPPAAPVDELIDLDLPAVTIAAPPGPEAEPDDGGPPTQPIDAVTPSPEADAEPDEGDDEGDDEFLAELRKAMTDDEPLGPRDDDDGTGRFPFDDRAPHSRPRFGRRR
jgi:DivIVA domain-containing protein